MRSNKTYKYRLNHKFNDYNQSVIVSLDIKNIMLIAYTIYAPKHLFYISKTSPL